MLRVTIELVPFGNESAKRILTTGEIWNDDSSKEDTSGNYGYELKDCGQLHSRTLKKGEVKNFPRLKKNVWHLLEKVLNNANLD